MAKPETRVVDKSYWQSDYGIMEIIDDASPEIANVIFTEGLKGNAAFKRFVELKEVTPDQPETNPLIDN